jgi:hypothetical protein
LLVAAKGEGGSAKIDASWPAAGAGEQCCVRSLEIDIGLGKKTLHQEAAFSCPSRSRQIVQFEQLRLERFGRHPFELAGILGEVFINALVEKGWPIVLGGLNPPRAALALAAGCQLPSLAVVLDQFPDPPRGALAKLDRIGNQTPLGWPVVR